MQRWRRTNLTEKEKMQLKTIHDLTLDEERALYGVQNARIENCTFDGPADGESALKETRGTQLHSCCLLYTSRCV